MGLLSWIVFGAVAGWVASWIAGRQHGCCLNIVIGIVGAFLGGLLIELVTGHGFTVGFNLRSFAMAVVGAVVLLAITGLASRSRR